MKTTSKWRQSQKLRWPQYEEDIKLEKNWFRRPLKVFFQWMLTSIKCYLPLKVVFNWMVSSIQGYLSLMVVFHWKLSSMKSQHLLKVVFHQRISSVKGHILPKVISLWKVLFHGRLFLGVSQQKFIKVGLKLMYLLCFLFLPNLSINKNLIGWGSISFKMWH